MYKTIIDHKSNIALNLEIHEHNTKLEAMKHGKHLLRQLEHGRVYVTNETKCPEVYILIGCKSYGKVMVYKGGRMEVKL